jgi:hypothetical protein
MLARPLRASLAGEAGGAACDAADAGEDGEPAEDVAVGATESGAWGFWVQAETAVRSKAHASRAPDPGETENGSKPSTIGARLPQRLGSREAPTLAARDEILGFFASRLGTRSRPWSER